MNDVELEALVKRIPFGRARRVHTRNGAAHLETATLTPEISEAERANPEGFRRHRLSIGRNPLTGTPQLCRWSDAEEDDRPAEGPRGTDYEIGAALRPSQRLAAHEALRRLAKLNLFRPADRPIGPILAVRGFLSTDESAVAQRIALKYRDALSPPLVAQIEGRLLQ